MLLSVVREGLFYFVCHDSETLEVGCNAVYALVSGLLVARLPAAVSLRIPLPLLSVLQAFLVSLTVLSGQHGGGTRRL